MRLSYFKNASGSTEVLEKNDYYPFGLSHSANMLTLADASYQYQYSGKELQKETGWSDFGARMYMSDIARWGVIDPLAETTTRVNPYNYALDNPVMYVDPDGRKAQYLGSEYELFGVENSGIIERFMRQANGFGNFSSFLGDSYFYKGAGSSGGGGSGGSTFGETQAYNDVMTAWQNGKSFNLVNSGGYLKWWTDLGREKEGLIGAFNVWRLNPYKYDTETHKTSQTLRTWSGYAFSANKFVFQPAADRALLYGAGEAYSTTNLVFEKALPKLLSSRKIYVPLMEISVKNAQRLAVGTKVAGRVLGGAGLILAGVDMGQNGVTTSNSIDLVMSVLAVSPTGWGQAIAGGYFLANGITMLVTGKDIGQHIDGAVNKYYNDGVRAEEQRKFNAAMGY